MAATTTAVTATTMAGLLQPLPLYHLVTMVWATAGSGLGEVSRRWTVLVAVVAGDTDFELFLSQNCYRLAVLFSL